MRVLKFPRALALVAAPVMVFAALASASPAGALSARAQVSHESLPAVVESGGLVVYRITITNDGDAVAADVAVLDEVPSNGVYRDEHSSPSCDPLLESGSVLCVVGPIPTGESREVAVAVQAPSGPATMTNVATIAVDQQNFRSTASTEVATPGDNFGATFCPSTGCSTTTDADGSGATASDPTVREVEVPADPAAPGSVVSISEFSPSTINCTSSSGWEVSFLPPEGYANPGNPIHVDNIFDKSLGLKPTMDVCMRKPVDGKIVEFKVPNCIGGTATPSPCVHKRKVLPNGDVKLHILFLSGDPNYSP